MFLIYLINFYFSNLLFVLFEILIKENIYTKNKIKQYIIEFKLKNIMNIHIFYKNIKF